MKIVHISDVHIRNLKYHSEYRRVFENLYENIEIIKPDLVINTGDTAHTKNQISPEYVEMTSNHIREVIKRCPDARMTPFYHILPGNHDMNLMNPERQDAITPIIESINDPRVQFLKKSGRYEFKPGFNLWAFSLADQDHYPIPSDWEKFSGDVNIGLFHGSVSTCVTDSNFRMTHVEHDLSIFEGLDYALLGDIHKQQFFKDRRIAYAGSLIQQNFGEEIDKGFLLWEIEDKENFTVTPVHLKGSRKFHTIKLNDDLSVPELPIEEGSRIRISPPRQITLVEQKAVEKQAKKLYKPHDIITLSATNIGGQLVKAGKKSVDIENIRRVEVQERLIRDFLKDRNISENAMSKIMDMNRRYQIHVDQTDEGSRNVSWKINKILWSNMFNYGESNVIDFENLGGLTGLFAPNGSGKSNFIDIILEVLFDSITKGISKNIHIINDNKSTATGIAEVVANNQTYLVERKIERIKYGQKKFEEEKEWGKTDVDFSSVDEFGGKESLREQSRPNTERKIRDRIGTFEDFMLTSLSAQWNPLDIVACKETQRKQIFFRFFDLDFFGVKCLLAKEESREPMAKLADLEDNGIEEMARKYRTNIKEYEAQISDKKMSLDKWEVRSKEEGEEMLRLTSQKVPTEVGEDNSSMWEKRALKAEHDIGVLNERFSVFLRETQENVLKIAKIMDVESKFDADMHRQKVKELEEKIELLRTDKDIRAKALTEIEVHKKNVAILGTVPCGDQFPSCRFLVNGLNSKKIIEIIQLKIEAADLSIKAKEAEIVELTKFKERLEKYEQLQKEKKDLTDRNKGLELQMENANLKIGDLRKVREESYAEITKIKKNAADIEKNRALDQEIENCRRRREKTGEVINGLRKEIQELIRKAGSDEGILSKLQTQLDVLQETRDTCSAYEHYIEAMGKDGIAYQIMCQKLPLLNEEINKILANTADFGVFVEDNPEDSSVSIYLQYGEYKRRLLELGGGAEKMLASLAIRSALLSISNLPKTNMFIIDEGFGKLDPKNLEAMQRMFDYLRSVFDHVLVVSHIDSMKDMVDNMIDITTDDEGYAHVEIGA